MIARADWYLREWLETLRMTKDAFREQSGWTVRINNQLINRKLRWNRDHLDLAARILKIAPHELLLHPADAMAMRRLHDNAVRIAAEPRLNYHAEPNFNKATGTY